MMRIMSKHCLHNFAVMPGRVPGIHVVRRSSKDVDGPDTLGHDGSWA